MKNMKRFFALAACMVLCLAFLAGCGADSKYIGTWEATEAQSGTTVLKASDIYKNFTLELKAGGKATVNLNGEASDGTWKETSDGVSIDNDDVILKADGDDKLTLTDTSNGATITITFERQ